MKLQTNKNNYKHEQPTLKLDKSQITITKTQNQAQARGEAKGISMKKNGVKLLFTNQIIWNSKQKKKQYCWGGGGQKWKIHETKKAQNQICWLATH